MPIINGVYLKDFTALPGAVADANIIPIAITGNVIAYRTTVSAIVTDARVTSKLLTGLSVTGGAVVATDTILEAFGKVQNQINGKQGTITLTTTGSSGASSLIGSALNIPNYTLSGLGGVPTTRTLTINGTSQDLSADRTFSVGTVTSVGLSMPSAFSVASSPITGSGTIAVTGAGLASQYIRGDGQLADFPTGGGGGGSSVSYYLNGSVSQGTFVGNTYYEMNKTPVFGAGTDFTINADGYITQFITDAADPGSLLIPAGNWNFETYFSASSSGGSPSFYVELYKYNGTTFSAIASNSGTPELISFGTSVQPYFSSLAVPETVLTVTDRLAVRIYVLHSSKTITLHTEGVHLCQIVTTFTTGVQSLNGLSKQVQYFAVGTSGTDFAISSVTDTHTFNLPTASAANRGALSTTDWSTFNGKQNAITLTTNFTSGAATLIGSTLNIPNYSTDLSGYVPYTGANQTLAMGTNNGITLTDTGTNSSIIVNTSSIGFGGIRVNNNGIGTALWTANNSTGVGLYSNNQTTGTALFIDNLSTGNAIKVENAAAATGNAFIYTLGGAAFMKAKIDYLGNITGNSFVKTSGTAAQILAADGSVITAGTNITISAGVISASGGGGGTVTGTGTTNTLPKFTGASAIGDSAITDDGTTVTLVSRALSGTSASFSSTATAFAFIPTGSTVPANGMYLSTTNTLNFSTNTTNRLTISTTTATFSLPVTSSSTISAARFAPTNSTLGGQLNAIYLPATNTLGFATNGVDRLTISTTNAIFTLPVTGSAFIPSGATIPTNGMYLSLANTLDFATNSTNRLTITSGGNVGIGTTPSVRLQVLGGTITTNTQSTYALGVGNSSGYDLTFGTDASFAYIQSWGSRALQINNQGNNLILNATAGNVLIGSTTDGGARLQVNGRHDAAGTIRSTSITSAAAGSGAEMLFTGGIGYFIAYNRTTDAFLPVNISGTTVKIGTGTSGTDRLIVTSDGDVLVGMASVLSTSVLSVRAGLISGQTSGASSAGLQAWNQATSGDNKFVEFYTESGGSTTLRGSIDFLRSGTLTRYNTTSDANLKNLIGDSDKKKSINILNSTKIREYSWIADDTNKSQIGVIAQELYETYKGAVSVGSDSELFGTEDYKTWAVDKTAFTFHLIAGFQEHERIIQELKAEIDILKNN